MSRGSLLVAAVLLAACGGRPAGSGAEGDGDASAGDVVARPRGRPEEVWLAAIGRGPTQNARVCARGSTDPIARALCAQPGPAIDSLTGLLQVLGLGQGFPARVEAITTHSLGLAGRAVSALNPRVIFTSIDQHSVLPDRALALAFSRGEQLVELAAFDPAARTINFYLGHFRQVCNDRTCTPADLLTGALETGWQGFTLYAAEDLVDTPLDCLSCHQPGGPDGRRRFLMRQFGNPWMHWGGTDLSRADCLPEGITPVPDLLAERPAVTGEDHYAGMPLATLASRESGHDLESFIELANLGAGLGHELTPGARFPSPSLGEPFVLDTEEVTEERICGKGRPFWQHYRDWVLTGAGLPVPFPEFDVLDPDQRAALRLDYAGVLARNRGQDAFSLAASWMATQAAEASGFRSSVEGDPAVVLRQMCLRCHDRTSQPQWRRARFNVEDLSGLGPAGTREAIRRLSLALDDPQIMPPRRSGELIAPMRDQLAEYLRDRCGPACR